jgi:DNA-binding PadR family transcriptional regulator
VLSELETLVLRLLSDKAEQTEGGPARTEAHGVELMERSAGRLKPGTVYVILQRMVTKGFLRARWHKKERRKLVWVTAKGERFYRAMLAHDEALERMKKLSRTERVDERKRA